MVLQAKNLKYIPEFYTSCPHIAMSPLLVVATTLENMLAEATYHTR